MKKFRFDSLHAVIAAGLLACAGATFAQPSTVAAGPRAESARTAESVQLYLQLHKVLSHPRCVNCHPRDDIPKQGLEQRVHSPPMTRGIADRGPAGLPCASCHTDANFDPARVPGAPNWHLAPASMAWEGKSPAELCRALTDPARNGNRNLQATVKHLTEDKLVAWGWNPGIDVYGNPRQPVPVAKPEFDRMVVAWAKTGGACPD